MKSVTKSGRRGEGGRAGRGGDDLSALAAVAAAEFLADGVLCVRVCECLLV